MAIMMVAFWGGVIWIVLSFQRHNSGSNRNEPPPPPTTRQSPEDILHERLARGDIDADEYRKRHEALQTHRTP